MKRLLQKKEGASPLIKKFFVGGLILVIVCFVVIFSLTREGTTENSDTPSIESEEPTYIPTEVSITPSDMVKFKLADKEYTLGDILITDLEADGWKRIEEKLGYTTLERDGRRFRCHLANDENIVGKVEFDERTTNPYMDAEALGGVKIGDTYETVKAKLGEPNDQYSTPEWEETQSTTYIYMDENRNAAYFTVIGDNVVSISLSCENNIISTSDRDAGIADGEPDY